MLKYIYSSLLIGFLFTHQVISQTDSILFNENQHELNRTRFLFGYSTIIKPDEKPELKNIFLNVNYRTSDFNFSSPLFRLKWAFEFGLNTSYLQDDDLSAMIVVPYVKTGPEINLHKNLFIGSSFEIASTVIEYFTIFPYAGINTYYLYLLTEVRSSNWK